MKTTLQFVGYKAFNSKKGNLCYRLDFLGTPQEFNDKSGFYSSNIAIFCDKEKYAQFIKNNQLLSRVECNFEIAGNRVIYSI